MSVGVQDAVAHVGIVVTAKADIGDGMLGKERKAEHRVISRQTSVAALDVVLGVEVHLLLSNILDVFSWLDGRVSFRTKNITPRALIHAGEILQYSRAWQRVAGNRNLIALPSINNTKSDSEPCTFTIHLACCILH